MGVIAEKRLLQIRGKEGEVGRGRRGVSEGIVQGEAPGRERGKGNHWQPYRKGVLWGGVLGFGVVGGGGGGGGGVGGGGGGGGGGGVGGGVWGWGVVWVVVFGGLPRKGGGGRRPDRRVPVDARPLSSQ